MAPRTINQRIQLQGDVAQQFSDIARAGEQAFARIRTAANENRNIDLNLTRVRQQLDDVGRAGEQAFQRVRRAAADSGQATGEASRNVQQQAGFFSTLAGRITVVVGALAALGAGYLAAAQSASQSVVDLGRQADAARLSITNFQNLRGTLQQLNLTESEGAKAADGLRTAVQRAFDEGKKALDDFGFRFAPVTQQVQRFGAEMEIFGTRFISGRTGAHSLMEAIQALTLATSNGRVQLSETSRTLLSMQAVFDPLTGKIREGAAAWIPFAEGVRRMKDETAAARLVNSVFGEEIGRVLLPAMRAGNGEFVRAFDSISRLNLGFTEAQRKVGQDMVNAFARLKLATSQARTEFGLAFAPIFTPGINALADAIRRNQSVITQFVNQLVSVAKPAIDSFFNSITRFLDSPASFDRLRDIIVQLGSAISQIFTGIIVPAFRAFGQAATQVAGVISRVFGAEVTPAMVGVGATVAALIGPFNTLALAIGALFAGEGAQFDGFRQQLAAIGIDVDALKAQMSGIFEAIVAELPGIIETVKTTFNGIKTVLEFTANAINQIFGTEVTAAGLAVVAVLGTITGAFSVFAAVLAPIAAVMGIVAAGMIAVSAVAKTLATAVAIVGGVLKVFGLIVTGIAAVLSSPAIAIAAVVTALTALVAALILFPDQVRAIFQTAWDFIVRGANAAVQLVIAAFSGLVNILVAPFQIAANIIIGIWEGVIDIIRRALTMSQERGSIGGNSPGNEGAPFYSGGFTGNVGVRRIAGVVHGGEYVQPARVVRQPGVLAFMETLRRVGDLRTAIQMFARGFSVGGLVDNFSSRMASLAVPQFAAGGFVPSAAGGRPSDFGTVMLDMGSRGRVRIMTDADSVAAIRRVAVRNQILSAGRESS